MSLPRQLPPLRRSTASSAAPVPAADAFEHVHEALERHGGVALANFVVDRTGRVLSGDAIFHELSWSAPTTPATLRTSAIAAVVPTLIDDLAARALGAGRTVHDAWPARATMRARYWLMPAAIPGLTAISLYLQFA